MTMLHLGVLFAVLWMSTLAFSIPTFNITIPVPDGTSNHGDPSILCTPTRWTSILSFFFGNYIAHAATTLSYPGEELYDYAQTVVGALLFPSTGVYRGLDAIFRCARHAESELVCATRAGALDAVGGRGDDPGWDLPFLEAPFSSRKIHGVVRRNLPPGFEFRVIPRNAVIETPTGTADAPTVVMICTSQQTAKLMVAIFQTLYGVVTLYRARGDQLARYGYAAFALTVTPYTVMSLVNLVGALLTPTYPTMYLVRSDAMDEVNRHPGGPYFDGTVGRFKPTKEPIGFWAQAMGLLGWGQARETVEQAEQGPASRFKSLLFRGFWNALPAYIVYSVAGGIPLAILGSLTKFRPGDSTRSQQVWLMMWLGFGLTGIFLTRLRYSLSDKSKVSSIPKGIVLLCVSLYSAPAIGGMVVVGKMMKEYGDCIRLD
ncbi:hypothetical protein B0H16DRAFT_1453328 [Mycena metata]|uniref:Uncharacterized protein n=1 Tax=Mycena metata TaxID=1033252 RepID=A0AAD7JPA1_9AGAR|nr:hypothetical protein B0H16DRAFT_1453328 [Mycena metata]